MKASKMTLRDYFAGLAMQTILTDGFARHGIDGCDSSKVSELAYKIAKDMIDESESMKVQELDRQKIGEYWPEQGGIYFGTIAEDGELYALIVARQEDGEEEELGWKAANEFCRKLKIGGFDDWALPSRYDLLMMFMNNYGDAGDFSEGEYWSSIESGDDGAWFQTFGCGAQDACYKGYSYSVRAVRKVLISHLAIKNQIDESESMKDQELDRQKIGEYWPEQGGIYFGRIEEDGELYALIVARQEDGGEAELSWQAANEFCRKLKIGGFDDWALPSRYDLQTMHKNNYGDACGFIENYYWSSTEFLGRAWIQHLNGGDQHYNGKDSTHSVRAVRKVLI